MGEIHQSGDSVGRYQIVRVLAEGGAGNVYEAVQVFLQRRAALKVLNVPPLLDAAKRHVVALEAVALSRVRHPHVLAVQDAGVTSDGVVFIATNLLDCETLRDRLGRRGRLSPLEATCVARQVAEGLEAAHELGVFHGDLRPDNVFVDRDGVAKLADLGTARLIGCALPETQELRWVGTPAYMSPERLQGHELDAASDVYALGLFMYELVAGFHALTPPDQPAPSLAELAARQLDHEIAPLPEVVPSCPAGLWRVIRKALHKQPQRRQRSMREIAFELLRVEYELRDSSRRGQLLLDEQQRAAAARLASSKRGPRPESSWSDRHDARKSPLLAALAALTEGRAPTSSPTPPSGIFDMTLPGRSGVTPAGTTSFEMTRPRTLVATPAASPTKPESAAAVPRVAPERRAAVRPRRGTRGERTRPSRMKTALLMATSVGMGMLAALPLTLLTTPPAAVAGASAGEPATAPRTFEQPWSAAGAALPETSAEPAPPREPKRDAAWRETPAEPGPAPLEPGDTP